jgi:hypothetical protein
MIEQNLNTILFKRLRNALLIPLWIAAVALVFIAFKL